MRKHIKLLLRTLFSNNACVEAARTKEIKYNVIAIIFALLALFISALPTCVTGFQQKGGNWLRGTTYAYDTAMWNFKEDANEAYVTLTLTKNEKGQHILTDDGTWSNFPYYDQEAGTELHTDLHCFISKVPDAETTDEHKIMEIYYCSDKKYFNLYVTELSNNINPERIKDLTGKAKKEAENDENNWLEGSDGTDKKGNPIRKKRSTSFIVFGTNQVFGALFAPGNTSAGSSAAGDYANTSVTKAGQRDFINDVLVTSTTMDSTQILKDSRKFFDQAYINTRNTATWRSTGIILGVNSGVILLMGLMVWILTRGKNNPFRIYSIWDGQKIAYYASFTPGLLALFGFLMSNLAMMLFIIGVGIRVMWLSMRTLRYQAPAKQ